MVTDTSQKFLSAASSYMTVTLGSRSETKNFYVSFCTEDFRSLLGCLQIIYWRLGMVKDIALKFLSATISTYSHDLGVTVTDRILMLKILC